MNVTGVIIREIRPADNAAIARIIRQVLEDFGVPKTSSSYADPLLDDLHTYYNKDRAVYYIIEYGGTPVGGAGITPLENYTGNVCELQKMYFKPTVRGKGIGARLLKKCLESAVEFGYEACYLETMPYMKAAQTLYQRFGFEYLEGSMGDTGHTVCPVWMLKKL